MTIKQNQLPYLIKLLDDESDNIRNSIIEELITYGPTLKTELRKFPLFLSPNQRQCLQRIYSHHKRMRLKQLWPSCFNYKRDVDKIESALSILAEFLSEYDCDYKLSTLLDQLASGYMSRYKTKNPKLLAQYLFKEKALSGNESDYYNPQNSNLIYVITQKRGIPISLASVYMLVGSRLGLKIEGCHFPGHFLAKINYKNEYLYVDCYNYGQIFTKNEIMEVRKEMSDCIEFILNEKVRAETMIRRFLANMIRCYQADDDEGNSELMSRLFQDLDWRILDRRIAHVTPEDIIYESQPAFEEGDVVFHQRYGYRGIIVEIDDECEATDRWYYSNQTQPLKNQPWYHVLVDGTDQVTYVAESNLDLDESNKKFEHPLLTYFFTEMEDGTYIRNDNPWPDTDF